MYLLLDECVSPSLTSVARSLGHTAQRTIETAVLGRHASDQEIFDFARRVDAVLVTVNRGDFISIARHGRDHAGIIVIPSLPRDRLKPLFEAVLAAAEPLLAQSANLFIEIDATGRIASFRLP